MTPGEVYRPYLWKPGRPAYKFAYGGNGMALDGWKELVAKIRKETTLTDDQAEEELNKLLPKSWVPKNVFNEQSEAAKLTNSQLAEANKQLETIKGQAGTSAELKKQLDDLTAKQKEQETAYKSQIQAMTRGNIIDDALRTAKAKNLKATRALLDDSKIAWSEDGKTANGLKEQIEAIQKDNEYLFETSQPGGQGGGQQMPGFGGGQGGANGGGGDLLAEMMSAAGVKAETPPAGGK